MDFFDILQKLDTQLFLFLNSVISCTLLNYFFVAITDARFWIVPAIVATVLFIKQEHNKALIVVLLALLTIAISDPVSSQIFKPLLHRPRPCHPDFFVNSAHMLFGFKSSLSFPSSHSTNMFALAFIFTKFYPSRWHVFFAFASLIGFSRIYVGVHYPADVVGGALLGLSIAWIVYEGYLISTKWRISIISRRVSRKNT
jgi:undecaprenyl-diphosphatase